MLTHSTGLNLQMAYNQSLKSLGLFRLLENSGKVPLAAFGWVVATNLSVSCYSDSTGNSSIRSWSRCAPKETPAAKEFCKFGDARSSESSFRDKELTNQPVQPIFFSWKSVVYFFLWASMWELYELVLCGISVKDYGGLSGDVKEVTI